MYGLYTNMALEMFMLNLLDTPIANRHCYELLVENVPCKAYADVEWEGPEDPDHSELWRLVACVRTKVREELSHEPKNLLKVLDPLGEPGVRRLHLGVAAHGDSGF
jgi:hypothetical protein